MSTKFIVINPRDIIVYMKPYNVPYRCFSHVFYKIESIQYMKDNNIEVISIGDFVKDKDLKFNLRDFNNCEKFYLNDNTDELKKIFYEALDNLFNQITNTDHYDNSIIYAILPISFDYFLREDNFKILKSKKIDVIIFHDDLHGFSKKRNNLTSVINKKIEELQFKDARLEKCKKLLSHSKLFFDYIGMYLDKTILYHCPLDDFLYSMFSPHDFLNRKNKILLSGSIGGYPLRNKIWSTLKNKSGTNKLDKANADQLYDLLENHIQKSIEYVKKGALYSYFYNLATYQGAFYGFYEKPLNFITYKIFEILACGTLLFCEESEEIDKIGMVKFVHYVPINENNIFDTKYINKYLGTQEGYKIAINGNNFVRSYLNNKKNLDFFINLIKEIKKKN